MNTELLIVFPFLVLILSILLSVKLIHLKQCYFWISEKNTKPPLTGFPIVGGAWGGHPPLPPVKNFFEPSPLHQNRCPPLKNEALFPIWKTPSPPLTEMQSTLPWTYSQQLYYQMNSVTGIFWQHFKPPSHAPSMYWLKPPPPSNFEEPPMFSTPVGNPD